jgi:hypothetical protein
MMTLRERPVTSSTCSASSAFDDVLEADDARFLGEDRNRERIPLGELLARLDFLAVLDLQLARRRRSGTLALTARCRP